MGDRVRVELTVLECQREDARALFTDKPSDDAAEVRDGIALWWFAFHEVNYGVLPFTAALEAHGIAFESRWQAGCEFGPGTYFVRYSPTGEIERREVSDSALNPPLDALLERIDDPEALRRFILRHRDETVPRDWAGQQHYGQRYRARQLIAP